MYMVMKFSRVPANRIGPLHTLFASDTAGAGREGKIMKAKSDDGKNYVVEIGLRPVRDGQVIMTPLSVVKKIFDTLGIFPISRDSRAPEDLR